MSGPTVAGEPAADRLMRSLDYRQSPDIPRLSRPQVAVVLHALADHAALEAARRWAPDPSLPWPTSLSIGRWLHDTGDQLTEVPDA